MNFKRFFAAAMSAAMLLSSLAAYAAEADVAIEGEEQDNITITQQVVSNFTMPRNQRATIITPTVDYLTGETYTAESAEAELDELFTSLSEIGLNTVYINTVCEGVPFFTTDMNVTDYTD